MAGRGGGVGKENPRMQINIDPHSLRKREKDTLLLQLSSFGVEKRVRGVW